MYSFNRRNFLTMFSTSVAGVAAGSFLSLPAEARENANVPALPLGDYHAKTIAPDDETFWTVVREQFPIIRTETDLNTGTMGPSPAIVTETLQQRIAYVDSTADYGGAERDLLRENCAKLLNCSADEIGLAHNVSECISIIAAGLKMKEGDEVILSTHEHVGNSMPWIARRQRDGIVIRTFVPGKSQQEILRSVESLITPRTRIIALPHISCTIGQVFPVKELAELAHAHNVLFMADGAHPPGMMPVDVKQIGCDFYTTCGHKWLCGPKGTGFFFIKKELLDQVDPVWTGGESATSGDLFGEPLVWLPSARRYSFATQNNALYFAMNTAIDFFQRIGLENVQARTRYLSDLLRAELRKFSSIDVLTPDDSHSGLIGFYTPGVDFHVLAQHLSENENIRIRIVPEVRLNSIRISTHVFNSPEDVTLLVKGLKEICN